VKEFTEAEILRAHGFSLAKIRRPTDPAAKENDRQRSPGASMTFQSLVFPNWSFFWLM